VIHMAPGPWTFDFIKQFERFRPTAYKPTPDDVWTLGYGHTKGVKEGDTCTMSMALEWLQDDIAEASLNICRGVIVPLSQPQFDALVSLVFNEGYGVRDGKPGDIADSTLLHKLNARDYVGAAAEFPKWKYQGKKVLGGLVTRRAAERAHFEGKDLVA
jgi:lysozyme